MARVPELRQAMLDRLGIITHPLEAALVQEALLAAGELEQPPLERSRADVGDQNLH